MNLRESLRDILGSTWSRKPEALMAAAKSIRSGKPLAECLAAYGMTRYVDETELAALQAAVDRLRRKLGKDEDDNA